MGRETQTETKGPRRRRHTGCLARPLRISPDSHLPPLATSRPAATHEAEEDAELAQPELGKVGLEKGESRRPFRVPFISRPPPVPTRGGEEVEAATTTGKMGKMSEMGEIGEIREVQEVQEVQEDQEIREGVMGETQEEETEEGETVGPKT